MIGEPGSSFQAMPSHSPFRCRAAFFSGSGWKIGSPVQLPAGCRFVPGLEKLIDRFAMRRAARALLATSSCANAFTQRGQPAHSQLEDRDTGLRIF